MLPNLLLSHFIRPEGSLPMITSDRQYADVETRFELRRVPATRSIPAGLKVKWGSATRVLPARPSTWDAVKGALHPLTRAPRAHDVLIGRVAEMGRHTGLELDSGRKSRFYPGDVLGLVFGHRYATRQFLGDVPPLMSCYHILSQGGVCGRVLSAPPKFSDPTLIEPLGYWTARPGEIANLRDFAPEPLRDVPRTRTILVVGSSMDAGKSTTAASLVRGLTHAGRTVHAGKLTGTACVKDLNLMGDAGAVATLDFSQVGYASTSQESRESIELLCETIRSRLSAGRPDYLVLEIADGLTQRETRFVVDYFTRENLVDDICLAVHDALAAPTCIRLLEETWDLRPTVVSGVATISPLSTQELENMCEYPCLCAHELAQPEIVERLEAAVLQP